MDFAFCGNNFIGVIKTNHAGYPKKFLEQIMKNWPAGLHLVLEAMTSQEVALIAVGYKYNKKKVMFFLFNKGASHTEPASQRRI